MSNAYPARREFGEGPLSRAVAMVYSLLVVELLLLVTTVPGLVPLLLLDRDASNVPLVALCALPLGPAVAAAVYAVRRHPGNLTDLRPAAAFWHGYAVNLRPVLRLWIPWLAVLTILAVNLTHFPAAGVPGWWAIMLILVAVTATLWVVNVLVITALFTFRARDVARLAGYFLVHRVGVTVSNVCLLVVAAGITYASSEAVLALLGAGFVLLLLRNCRPMIDEIGAEFIA